MSLVGRILFDRLSRCYFFYCCGTMFSRQMMGVAKEFFFVHLKNEYSKKKSVLKANFKACAYRILPVRGY